MADLASGVSPDVHGSLALDQASRGTKQLWNRGTTDHTAPYRVDLLPLREDGLQEGGLVGLTNAPSCGMAGVDLAELKRGAMHTMVRVLVEQQGWLERRLRQFLVELEMWGEGYPDEAVGSQQLVDGDEGTTVALRSDGAA